MCVIACLVISSFQGSSSSSSSEASGVHRGIQQVAQRYCVECKSTYLELSKVVQGVLASRKELVKYDQKKAELGAVPSSEPSTPAVLSTPLGASDEVTFDLWLKPSYSSHLHLCLSTVS